MLVGSRLDIDLHFVDYSPISQLYEIMFDFFTNWIYKGHSIIKETNLSGGPPTPTASNLASNISNKSKTFQNQQKGLLF